MTEKNNKVPIAILSCFLIAFILQGVLKISGILVFEKVLDWEIFIIIDSNFILQVIYYSVFLFISIYCLAFSLTSKPYSRKWYHYIIILATAMVTTIVRLKVRTDYKVDILIDILIYLLVPFIINITTESKDRLSFTSVDNIIISLSMQIALYLCYIGLNFWSGLLTSIIAIDNLMLSASANFLVQLEVYLGLALFMLSINIIIHKIKERENMFRPMNIASDEAKVKELEEKKAKKNSKKNGK